MSSENSFCLSASAHPSIDSIYSVEMEHLLHSNQIITMDHFKKPDETIKLLEHVVSDECIDNKRRKLTISILQWIYHRGNQHNQKFKTNRIELCLLREGENNYSISISPKAFIWLIDCFKIEENKDHLRENKITCSVFDEFNIYSFITLSEIYSQVAIFSKKSTKCYGIGLNTKQKRDLSDFYSKIKFILDLKPNDNNMFTENKLALYYSILAKEIKRIIKERCNGCKSNIAIHECNELFRNRNDKYDILELALSNPIIENELIIKMESISRMLKMETENKYDMDTIQQIKLDKEKLIMAVQNWIDLNLADKYNFDEFFSILPK